MKFLSLVVSQKPLFVDLLKINSLSALSNNLANTYQANNHALFNLPTFRFTERLSVCNSLGW